MSERQFPPTARKLKRARMDGDSAKSSYVSEMIQVFGGLGLLLIQFRYAWLDVKSLVHLSFRDADWQDIVSLSVDLVVTLICTPLLVSGMVGIALDHLQNLLTPPGGAIWISPSIKLNKLSLTGGVKKIGYGIRKMPLLVTLVVLLNVIAVSIFARMGVMGSAQVVSDSFRQLFFLSLVAYLLVSSMDVILNRQAFVRRNRMTRQELLNELKDEEGNPMLKAQMRALRESMTYAELSRRVKRSKVIVVSRQR